jgi:hypothetical protein
MRQGKGLNALSIKNTENKTTMLLRALTSILTIRKINWQTLLPKTAGIGRGELSGTLYSDQFPNPIAHLVALRYDVGSYNAPAHPSIRIPR